MILGAGLLVLAGLGLFVAALLTGTDALYWGCVAACVVAAGLLVAARRGIAARSAQTAPAADAGEGTSPPGSAPASLARAAGGPQDATSPVGGEPAAEPPAGGGSVAQDEADPGIEEVEVTDLLLVVDLKDEVLVVDERPRYHVAGCAWLGARETIPIPLDEARTDGFTPCAVCSPDRTLAGRARARR